MLRLLLSEESFVGSRKGGGGKLMGWFGKGQGMVRCACVV